MILDNSQRRATKMVNSLSNLTYEERLKKLGLPTLNYHRMTADVIEVYKIINQHDRVNVDKFFTIMENVTTRGNTCSRKLYIKDVPG